MEDPSAEVRVIEDVEMELAADVPEEVGLGEERVDVREVYVPPPQVPSVGTLLGDIYELRF